MTCVFNRIEFFYQTGSGTGFFPDPTNMKRFCDPVSLKVLNLVPLPTNDALVNNFQGPISPARNITDEVTARIDYHISSKDTFYGRYIYNFNHDFVGDLFPLFGPSSSDRSYRRNRHNQNVSLSETHIFTSSVFNEARAGWNRSFTFEELETSFRDEHQYAIGHCRPVAPHAQPPGMGSAELRHLPKFLGARAAGVANRRSLESERLGRSGTSPTTCRSCAASTRSRRAVRSCVATTSSSKLSRRADRSISEARREARTRVTDCWTSCWDMRAA
jgi:hypothetical protein